MQSQTFRNVFSILLVVILLILGCSRTEPTEEKSTAKSASEPETVSGTIVAMGDSLTAGYDLAPSEAYPTILEKLLLEKGYAYKVINAGNSGETSSGAVGRMDWVLTARPDILILETGANDGLRGIDPAVTRSNIEKIVSFFQANKVIVVLAGMRMPPNLGQHYTQAFAGIYTAIAKKHRLIFIPFFLEGVAGEPRLNLPDGIHPTPEGYRVVAQNLLPYVIEAIHERKNNP